MPAEIMYGAQIKNQWFTPANIKFAAESWHKALQMYDIENWLKDNHASSRAKKVGIIMAGNIPMVGLHDLLCVLAAGHHAMVKLSGQDEVLMRWAIENLKKTNPSFEITITDSLKDIDALIATGSNNSSRYFEYYFKDIPIIIRKNRTSIAVLNGLETEKELFALADDIFTHFGLGCRNVTHLLLPKNFELKPLYEAYDKYIDIVHHNKYYNNYMYHKSILLMNLTKHYDNGFMLFQNKTDLHTPISTLNYHFYNSENEVLDYIAENEADIQCVVSKMPAISHKIDFGNTQLPSLNDYADNVNVLNFLKEI